MYHTRFLNNCLRPPHEASDSQDGPLSNPIACRVTWKTDLVHPSARSSRTRRSPSVLTVTSWHPNPSIHFASKRAACGSPPPVIETAAANVMPVRLSLATNSGVESPLCDTQTNCGTIFTIATALFCHRFLFLCFVENGGSFSAFYLVVRQEDGNTHKAILCKYLSRSEENVPSVGQEMTGGESSEPSPFFQLQLVFPVPAVMPQYARRSCAPVRESRICFVLSDFAMVSNGVNTVPSCWHASQCPWHRRCLFQHRVVDACVKPPMTRKEGDIGALGRSWLPCGKLSGLC